MSCEKDVSNSAATLQQLDLGLLLKECDIFNFADLYDWMGSVWSTTTRTWVNDATIVVSLLSV